MKKTDPFLIASGLALAIGLGCNRDQVQITRIEKAAPTLPPGHPLTEAPPAPMAVGEAPPQPQGTLKWTLPTGWTSEPAGGMRYATLKPSSTGKAEVSVMMLAGPAGGELANVNRWRTQLGLPPVEEAALASARKVVKSKAGPVAVFEFSNAGSRMVVGLFATTDGNTWFLKLTGDDAPVGQAKTDFMKLLGTLSLG